MSKRMFNHAFDIAFEVCSSKEDGSDVTKEMLVAGLQRRIKNIEVDSCSLYDSFEYDDGEDDRAYKKWAEVV